MCDCLRCDNMLFKCNRLISQQQQKFNHLPILLYELFVFYKLSSHALYRQGAYIGTPHAIGFGVLLEDIINLENWGDDLIKFSSHIWWTLSLFYHACISWASVLMWARTHLQGVLEIYAIFFWINYANFAFFRKFFQITANFWWIPRVLWIFLLKDTPCKVIVLCTFLSSRKVRCSGVLFAIMSAISSRFIIGISIHSLNPN